MTNVTLTVEEKAQRMIADSHALANQAREGLYGVSQALRERDYTTASSLAEVAKEQADAAMHLAWLARIEAVRTNDNAQQARAQKVWERASMIYEGARRVRIL